MMKFKIVEYGCLNELQKNQAVELFIEGFGHFMTFSKDEDLKRKLFFEMFHPALFLCCSRREKITTTRQSKNTNNRQTKMTNNAQFFLLV